MKAKLLLLFLLCFSLFSDNIKLSQLKQDLLDNEKNVANKSYDYNYNTWINPLIIKGSMKENSLYNDNGFDKHDLSISLSQVVYNFGGIVAYMRLADNYLKRDLILNKSNKLLIYKELYTNKLLYDKSKLLLDQAYLRSENNNISYEIKKEKYEIGEADIADINTLLIDIEKYNEVIVDIEYDINLAKTNMIKNTNIPVSSIKIPRLSLPLKKDFINKNINTLNILNSVRINNTLKDITESSYLPKINIEANYGDKTPLFNEDSRYYSYGISFTIPLSINTMNDIQFRKIKILESDLNLKNLKNDLSIKYDLALYRIKKYKDKKEIALKNILLYEDLLKYTKEEYDLGYKTKMDIKMFKNLLKITKKDILIQDILIQKEIYDLQYEMIN